MLSHWKQGAQNGHITKTVNFVKPGNFFKNRLRSLEPARNKGFYKHTLKTSVFILSTDIWISLKVVFPCVYSSKTERLYSDSPYLD